MSNNVLKSLQLQHLRGATEPFTLEFEKNKKLTIIYGENGTGKSTICDGLELLGKGRVGSIEDRGLGRVNRYWPSVGKSTKDISVTLESNIGACRAIIGRSDVVIDPPDKRPRVEVLRRAQILSLLETTAAKRYDAISRFIDVSQIESSEAILRELIREAERELQLTLARIGENEDLVEELWKQAGRPAGSFLQWATEEISRTRTDDDRKLDILDGLGKTFSQISSLASEIKRLKKNLDEAIQAREEASRNLDFCLAAESMDDARILHLLEATRSYLKRQIYLDACPVCGGTENIDHLLYRIEERLTTMARLREAQETLDTEQSAVQVIQNQLIQYEVFATQQIIGFEDYRHQAAAHFPDIKLPQTDIPEDSDEWPGWLSKYNRLLSQWKKAEREYQDKKQFRAALQKAVSSLNENKSRYEDLNAQLTKLRRALEIIVEERHQFTSRVLESIASEVSRLYGLVHPGEDLHNIRLQLEPNKRASLEIETAFQGQTAPPQAYYSESHLDTLGLCIFMALAGLDSPEETILVLDDVLASVDEPHIERLIEMVYQESLKYRHCVITTHYRPWKHKLRWGWLQNGQCQFVELTKWSAVNGLSVIRSVPDIERLRLLLAENPPDLQLVCAKAGVILEAALDFLTQQYECSVPRRPGGLYTLGDLLPAIDKKLRAALEVEVLAGKDGTETNIYQTIPLQPYLDELTRIAQSRNVFGCHFNALSFDLLDSDALAFGQQVSDLLDVLVDSSSGWPKNGKSGRYWATSGETRRLYPFKKPS